MVSYVSLSRRMTMRKLPRWAGTTLALWTALQAAACGADITGPGEQTQDGVRISAVSELVPGRTVTLNGQHLDHLVSLDVDGQAVDFSVQGSTTATFVMPSERTCDTDARPVPIVANGFLRRRGPLVLSDALHLEVGESRTLTAEQLSCIQIGAGAEDYLLAVGNYNPGIAIDPVAHFRSVSSGEAGVAASPATSVASALGPGAGMAADEAAAAPIQLHDTAASVLATPFDDYAGAQVGDTVRMVDWSHDAWVTANTKSDVPTYEAAVIAATPEFLVAVDLRLDNADQLVDAMRSGAQQAAEMAGPYTLPAIRAVIDPGFRMPQGAGGRVVAVVCPVVADGIMTEDIAAFRWSSDMFVLALRPQTNPRPQSLANALIHETAHLAAALPDARGTGAVSWGWYTEALAVTVADMAARMALGVERQAPWENGYDTDGPAASLQVSPGGGRHQFPVRDPRPASRYHEPWGLQSRCTHPALCPAPRRRRRLLCGRPHIAPAPRGTGARGRPGRELPDGSAAGRLGPGCDCGGRWPLATRAPSPEHDRRSHG